MYIYNMSIMYNSVLRIASVLCMYVHVYIGKTVFFIDPLCMNIELYMYATSNKTLGL